MRVFKRLFLVMFLLKGFLLSILMFTQSFSMTYEEIKAAYENSYFYEKQREYSKAIKVLEEVYRNYPQGYTVNLRLGWLYYLMGRYANSEYHYKKALTAIPSSVEAMLGLSLPYMAQKRWKKVENLMLKVIKVDFYNYYANLRLCYVFRKERRFDSCEKIARKMLSIYPTDVNFLLELAFSLYFEGKKKYSESILKDILILSPRNKEALDFLRRISAEK